MGQKTKVDMLRREVLSAKEVSKATEDKLQYEVSVLQLECAHVTLSKRATVTTTSLDTTRCAGIASSTSIRFLKATYLHVGCALVRSLQISLFVLNMNTFAVYTLFLLCFL